MQSLLREMNQYRADAVKTGKTLEEQVARFKKRYSIFFGKARSKYQVMPSSSGRPKKGRQRALIDRMLEHKDEVCLFISNLLVPFTNKIAEQSIWMMKVKNKMIGCFRTFTGVANFAAIISYLQTAMKHNISGITAIRNALAGNGLSTIFV